MSGNMLIHDTRLKGKTPRGLATNNWPVNGSVDTRHIFEWAGTYAGKESGLENLFIMCHGFAGYPSDRSDNAVLGNGLQLGKQNLTFENVAVASTLGGKVANIILFACGPANTAKSNANTALDGRRFCGELALYSGAYVVAAVQNQAYEMKRCIAKICVSSYTNFDWEIDFGSWEGPVYRFSPTDGVGKRVNL